MHSARQKLILATIKKNHDLTRNLRDYQAKLQLYTKLLNSLDNKPEHGRLLEFTSINQPQPEAMAQWQIAKQNPTLSATNPYHKVHRIGANLLKNATLQHDGWQQRSFLEPKIPTLSGWQCSIRPNQYLRVRKNAYFTQGLDFSGADMLLIQQIVPVKSAQHYLLKANLAWRVSPDNRSIIKLQWRNSNQKTILSETLLQLPHGISAKTYTFEIPCKAPDAASQLRIAVISSRQEQDYF